MVPNPAKTPRRWSIARSLLASMLLTPLPAMAQVAAPAAEAAQAPSESAMVNLVRALVAQGALKAEVGDALIRQAEAEAAQARATRQADAAALPPPAPGAIRVPYIPETVRAQIKDELRTEVLAEARDKGWASPDAAAPDWTKRFTMHGDIRIRSQSELYSRTNSNQIFDFATINSFGPYDLDNQFLALPYLNSINDQWNRLNIRARLGVDVQIARGVTAGITVATGDNAGPISTNTTLGGGFYKRELWLDKAWLRLQPTDWASITLGRMLNPFSSSDLLYDNDLNLDGAAIELNSGTMLGSDFKITARGGAFPVDFGRENDPIFERDKPTIPQKYLFAGEIAARGKVEDLSFMVSVGYHNFHNFQGRLSEPCEIEFVTYCSTDYLQPLFLTKGNTLSPLRNIVTVDPTSDRPQLLGYTFAYRILDTNASVTLPLGETAVARLSGSFVKNLGFDKKDICRYAPAAVPYNNDDVGDGLYCAATNPAKFVGGDIGYRGELLVGTIDPFNAGEWHVFAGYRYLESDAVLDAFTDSDFHLGGTNSKGYFLGANYALTKGLIIGGRWLSTNEISGQPFSVDVLQIDLQARF